MADEQTQASATPEPGLWSRIASKKFGVAILAGVAIDGIARELTRNPTAETLPLIDLALRCLVLVAAIAIGAQLIQDLAKLYLAYRK